MTISALDIGLYAAALFALFLTPGPVWLATAARTLVHGAGAAFPLVLGVALGDMIWSLVAILGLSWVVAGFSGIMTGLKWLAVLVFAAMGLLLIRNAGKRIEADSALNKPGAMAGFLAGLAAILANPKAILFYMGMMPGFFDLTVLTTGDIAVIVAVSMIVPVVGNMGFALIIDRARLRLTSPRTMKRVNQVAGGLLICVAVVILLF